MKLILVLSIIVQIIGVQASPCPSACTWVTWESWGSCSANCGGGRQFRNRDACCRSDATFDQCMSECHMISSESHESRCCGNVCYNGGSWAFQDRNTCTGRCSCPRGFKGSCCETACTNIPHCLPNQIECNFLSSRCLQCESPYISTGWSGKCRDPICNPVCGNNGTCIADDTCDCTSGFIGERCELGGNIDAFLLPTLHEAEQKPFQAMSWYDSPSFSEFGRICYVKVAIKNASQETLFTAQSFAVDGNTFGNFTTGPVDNTGNINSSERTACLQFRCPSEANNGNNRDILVKVFPITRSGHCLVTERTTLINTTALTNSKGHDVLTFHVGIGNNFGPAYGIYIGMGSRDLAIFTTRQQCLSGTIFNVNDINPAKGTLGTFEC